jgi:hypothetical protein
VAVIAGDHALDAPDEPGNEDADQASCVASNGATRHSTSSTIDAANREPVIRGVTGNSYGVHRTGESITDPLTSRWTMALYETREEIEANTHDGRVRGFVSVALIDVIDGDLEQFVDLLSHQLVGSNLLTDIDYRMSGASVTEIFLYVSGDPSMVSDSEPESAP